MGRIQIGYRSNFFLWDRIRINFFRGSDPDDLTPDPEPCISNSQIDEREIDRTEKASLAVIKRRAKYKACIDRVLNRLED